MRMTKLTDSDVYILLLAPQTLTFPAMMDGEIRRNLISQSCSLFYQCSTWTSNTTKIDHISHLIWLPVGVGGTTHASKHVFWVMNKENSTKFCLICSKTLIIPNILFDFSIETLFLLEDSEMVSFKGAVAPD